MARNLITVLMFGALFTFVNAANATPQFLREHAADVNKCISKKEPPRVIIEGCTALLKAIRESGKLTPKQVVVILVKRSVAYAKSKDHDRALSDVDKALGLTPKDSKLFFLRGNILLDSGKNKQAAIQFTRMIEANPRMARAYYLRARTYTQTGQVILAIKDLNKAIELAPEQADLPAYRAKLYANMGEYHKALKDLDKILVSQPRHATALRLKAMVLIASWDKSIRNVKVAVALARQSFLLKQSNASTNFLAMAYVADGRNEKAMELYDRDLKSTRSSRVMGYKKYLRQKGYYSGSLDGKYTPALRKAVEACLKEQCFKLFE